MPLRSRRRWRLVAITGSGAELGREIALGFATRGCIVFGTARSSAEVHDLKAASAGRVGLAVCDNTNANALKAWAGGVSDALDGAGLDLLINNAGIRTPGPMEALPVDAIRHTFEVNVFGALTVINAFLPALRKSRGRIVQISSWTAQVPLPFDGSSAPSWAAIEALSAVYRAELQPFGIDVVVASMGSLRTGVPEKMAASLPSFAASMTAKQRELYGKRFTTFIKQMSRLHASGTDTADAAARVMEIAEYQPAPSQAAIGPEAEEMLRRSRDGSDDKLDALRLRLTGLG